ncbi:MAG: 50S ribosomal protein L24e [Nanoarchaeota archaeon]
MSKCTFCGVQIEKGTGKMYVYVSGKISYFCSTKCEKNCLKLNRKPLRVRWTEASRKERGKS